MAVVKVRALLEAGVHYGHHTSRWNPRMKRFIFGKRNAIHIVNLVESLRGLLKARKFLLKLTARGHQVLLVGTKRAAAPVVASEAQRAGIPFVNERWLGGTLTNFQTIRSRLGRLFELEELEASGKIAQYSKKEAATLMRERRKIQRNLDGIRALDRLPGAVVVIDPRREKIAVLEARKLGIPVIALIDTDSDPSLINIAIPGNDDALRSVQLVLRTLMDSVMEGKELAKGEVTPIPGGEVVAVEGAPAAASPEEQPPAEGASADVGGPDAASPPTDAAGTEEKPPETSSGESPA